MSNGTPRAQPLLHTFGFVALAAAALLAGWALEVHGLARAGGLVRDGAVIAVGLGLIRLAVLLLFRLALPAAGYGAPRIVEEIVLALAYGAWVMLRLRLAGMDLASLVTTSAIITAVLAFAMQDTLGNVLGGLFLEIDRSVTLGDWVRVDDVGGRVEQIRWRHTAIRTRNGELVIIPNSALMRSRFTVIGNPDAEAVRWRRWIWFEVDFDVPAQRVVAAAEQALAGAAIPDVLSEPKPDCAVMELVAGHARYALRYWLGDPRRDDGTDSAVRMHLMAALERAGIEMSIPLQESHEITEHDERTALQARGLEARVAALRSVDLFAPLSPEELRVLAGHLVPAPFVAGDVVTRQGAVAHWLYLLQSGEVEVWLETGAGQPRKVADLGPGSVFGEMGMMTGEPRRATVTAKTDVSCFRLDKQGFEEILHARPALALAISKILEGRASGLELARDAARAGAATHAAAGSLIERIRTFFGLDPDHAGVPRAT